MNYTEIDYKRHLNLFEIENFTRNSSDYLYLQQQKEVENKIEISTNKFFPNSFTFQGLVANIRFNEVEQILDRLYSAHNIPRLPGESTISFVYNFNNPLTTIENRRVKDDQSFSLAAAEIHHTIDNYVLPFFDRYKSIERVASAINIEDIENINSLIPGTGMNFKILLIKKIANQLSNDESFLEKQKIFYTTDVFKYPEHFKNHDLVFQDLLNILNQPS